MVITTFTMVAFSGKRSEESEKVMQMIQSREWGLLLMDEVHVVPAQVCRVWKVWKVWIEKVNSTTRWKRGSLHCSWTRCTSCPPRVWQKCE